MGVEVTKNKIKLDPRKNKNQTGFFQPNAASRTAVAAVAAELLGVIPCGAQCLSTAMLLNCWGYTVWVQIWAIFVFFVLARAA